MTSYIKNITSILLFLFFSISIGSFAQTILPQKLVFSKMCAGRNFNEFDIIFNYSGFPTGTDFEIELSDENGSFSSPTILPIINKTDVLITQKKYRFSVPTTLIGSENYKIRVKSTTGFISSNFLNSASNESFPVYYKPYESFFSINNSLNTASICPNKNLIINIDNLTPSVVNSSPVNYSFIKYKWYKDSVLLTGQSTSSLVVSKEGVYFAEVDYGSCSDSNFNSNRVTVYQPQLQVTTINSSLGNVFCGVSTTTILSTEKADSYQWKKDDVLISGATNQTYETNQNGNYSVTVTQSGCETNANLNVQTYKISGTLNLTSPITMAEGTTKTIKVTSDTPNTIYSWYSNNIIIPNLTTDSFEAVKEGEYKVVLTHPNCSISATIPFTINFSSVLNTNEIPNLITPNNDDFNDTWIIPQKYTSGNEVEVKILSAAGEEIISTKNYTNNWPENTSQLKPNQSVYYYIITPPNEKSLNGSITVIR